MDRDALDAFFAQAEDVLTDWHGGTDAMHATPPKPDADEVLPPRVDSYYEQPRVRALRDHLMNGRISHAPIDEIGELEFWSPPEPNSPLYRQFRQVDLTGYLEMMNESARARARDNAARVLFEQLSEVIVRRIVPVFHEFAESLGQAARAFNEAFGDEPPPRDPRARALWMRQHRNTGPSNRRGLDGRMRA